MTSRGLGGAQARRARGALLGLAVGDALGTTLEFKWPEVTPLPARVTGPHRDITGGGPFHLAPGEVTDDTQMACCLAASLRARGAFDARDVVRRYIDWREVAFDVGVQTSAALRLAEAAPLDGGRLVWERRAGMKPAGNGSLMRAAPIGVFFADADARIAASWADSALTHYDPRCLLACVSFNAAIAAGVRGDSPAAMLEAASAELRRAIDERATSSSPVFAELRAAARDIGEDLRLGVADDPRLEGVAGGDVLDLHAQVGFVRVAFRLAVWELAHAPTLEAALVDVVNRGGDADTNGAIAGALLGAHHGEDAIPAAWRAAVLAAAGLRPEYHPRVLLELVDAAS
jgi:ADP-ribosyl-[dinitrogen reductase] hydrolase